MNSAFLASETFEKLSELNNFHAKITTLSSTLFIRGFKGQNLFWDLPFLNEKSNKNKLVYQNLSYHVKKLVITLKNCVTILKNKTKLPPKKLSYHKENEL